MLVRLRRELIGYILGKFDKGNSDKRSKEGDQNAKGERDQPKNSKVKKRHRCPDSEQDAYKKAKNKSRADSINDCRILPFKHFTMQPNGSEDKDNQSDAPEDSIRFSPVECQQGGASSKQELSGSCCLNRCQIYCSIQCVYRRSLGQIIELSRCG